MKAAIKRLKKRIKRALAMFFMDDVLEYLGHKYNREIQYKPIRHEHFEIVQARHLIEFDYQMQMNPNLFEDQVKSVKRQFAELIMENMDARIEDVFDPIHNYARVITLELLVAKKPSNPTIQS